MAARIGPDGGGCANVKCCISMYGRCSHAQFQSEGDAAHGVMTISWVQHPEYSETVAGIVASLDVVLLLILVVCNFIPRPF